MKTNMFSLAFTNNFPPFYFFFFLVACMTHFLHEALGNKTLVLYNEPVGRVLSAQRARHTSPLGRVVEFGGGIRAL